MLKVVGASWVRTRISTYIIVGMFILAICAFFMADIDRPQYDGTYCATAIWSKASGYNIEFWGQQLNLEAVPKGVARICYKDSIVETGWAQIEIETQHEYPDHVQAFAAGYLEGALTWGNIYSHYSNIIQPFCDDTEESQLFCIWLRDFLISNYNSIMESGKTKGMNHNQDQYWYQVRLFYNQVRGIASGFAKGAKRSRSDYEIPFEDFLLMNSWSDMKDLRGYYEQFIMNGTKLKQSEEVMNVEDVRGSMLLKVQPVNGSAEVLFGHSTAGSYSTMIRILKKYRLQYHTSANENSHKVPVTDMVFTGYPGIVSSLDDFYMISGDHVRITIGGVEMTYKNETLWRVLELDNSIFLSARLMTANRLCHSGKTWARIMARHPDTGSKQWIVADMKRFKFVNLEDVNLASNEIDIDDFDGSSNKNESESEEVHLKITKYYKGTFWIVDQVPGRLHAEDETEDVFRDGFFASNGFPYFDETYSLSGLSGAPRAFPLNLHENISDPSDMINVLRQRAFRGDLMFGDNKSAVGNIDLKVYSETNLGKSTFQAIAGPLYNPEVPQVTETNASSLALTHSSPSRSHLTSDDDYQNDNDNLPIDEDKFHPRKISVREDVTSAHDATTKSYPFRWSSSNLDADHFGQPDMWDFEAFSPKWAWTQN